MEKEIEIPADMLSVIFQSEFVPIGSVQCFAMITPPQGYLVCDGSEYLCCVYPDLYKAIGNMFGGTENRTFCVPDLRGQFVRGWDNQACVDEGRNFGTLQKDGISTHKHDFDVSSLSIESNGEHTHCVYSKNGTFSGCTTKAVLWIRDKYYKDDDTGTGVTSRDGQHSHIISANSNPIGKATDALTSNETRPKNIALQYCIKALSLVGFSSGASFKLTLNITETSNLIKSDSSFSEKEKNDFYDLIKEECMREDISKMEDFLNAAGQYIHENSLLNRVFGVKDEPLDGSQTPFDKPIYFLVEFVRKNRNYKFLPEEDNTIREMVFKHVNNFVSR